MAVAGRIINLSSSTTALMLAGHAVSDEERNIAVVLKEFLEEDRK